MCLIIDDREPTDLIRALQPFDLTTVTARLEFGDCMFEGSGPGDQPWTVAFERKTITDLVDSMQSRRLSGHQLHGLTTHYDKCYLAVEGMWRPGPNGCIERFNGKRGWEPMFVNRQGVSYRQVDSFLSSLELRWNIFPIRTANYQETAALYASRYFSWQKLWSKHRAHDVIYAPPPDTPASHSHRSYTTQHRKPRLIELIAAQLPGVDSKAWGIGKHFPTAISMVNATVKDWMQIDGIGKVTAHKVWKALREIY